MTRNAPSYSGKPIGSTAALARALGVDHARLARVARRADKLYRGPIIVKKPGKAQRETYAPSASLLDLQSRILDRILRRVRYPSYLMGGLTGRSYIQNARRHAGAKIVFGQDIEAFYPSVSRQRIESIFKHICNFAPEVASLLADLCSRSGVLVQGAPTSNHLGNLALYREEPGLEQRARANGLEYTRFVDDIHLSSRRRLPRAALGDTVRELRAAIERLGHRPKRAKQFIATPHKTMSVHRLNVNSIPSVPLKRRKRLRAEVFQLERRVRLQQRWDGELEAAYFSLCTRIGHLKHTNPGDAQRLKLRIEAIGDSRHAAEGTARNEPTSKSIISSTYTSPRRLADAG